ncbi:hypothetical protein IDH44_25610 [Paenibacillus sp. IB182496]|uniref:Uncharacterized protein n=1 Tax=Paenibacillus sabuli TaxID=2772509 RepID=A0A927BZF8_9BACL|nr:hypothetical protein [Paenibacillus sabuli]MBD2848570.1 hypothetical protein [Paenibacillus sabuli]
MRTPYVRWVLTLMLALAMLLTGGRVLQEPVVEKVELEAPYADARQQEVPFGYNSIYYAPWRAYMDTWDVGRYRAALGIGFNVRPEEADATAQVLAEAGIKTARIEIGWGALDYDEPARLQAGQERSVRTRLEALRRYGIRPLILLNANSGLPAPAKQWQVRLVAPAAAGATELAIDDVRGIVPRYTGLSGQGPLMFPVITAVDADSGTLTLSAPLPKALPAGPLGLAKLRVQPLSGATLAGGEPYPAAQETLDGWVQYVRTVTTLVKEVLDSPDPADAGFDLEVWNELSFGSEFLDINRYYEPDLAFDGPVTYSRDGKTASGAEVLYPLTLDEVLERGDELAGVRVVNGFANQRPWDNGTQAWPGQHGFSRHYYTGWEPERSIINADNPLVRADRLLDADGEIAAAPYVPEHTMAFPESWYYAYRTEYIVRDLQPFPGPWGQHYRYAHPGDGRPPGVWMTETNFYREPLARRLAEEAQVGLDAPELAALLHGLATKTTLRTYLFSVHKGVEALYLYAAKGGDTRFGVLPDAFFTALAADDYRLTARVRAEIGPQLQAMARVDALLEPGESIQTPRPLELTRLVEHEPQLVLEGNGTPQYPDVYQRDDFAMLPLQLTDRRFAIGYYVVTRDVTAVRNPAAELLDASRYAMTTQTYEATIANLAGTGARVYAYDPILDRTLKVEVVRASASELTVRLPTVDYPRFLMVEERGTQPLLESPELIFGGGDGTAALVFTTNAAGTVRVTWGPYPERSGSGAVELRAGAGERVRVELPGLAVHDGVRAELIGGAIRNVWPRWDYDVRGVRWPD